MKPVMVQRFLEVSTRTWDETQIGKGIFYYERAMNDAFLSVVT